MKVFLFIFYFLDCYLINESIKCLCEGLTNLSELKLLNLSSINIKLYKYIENSIDSVGIIELCNCFPYITKLQSLDLSGNNLLVEGVITICNNLSNLPFLHELNLIGNNCGKEGANYLLESVKNNKRIDISNNIDIIGVIYDPENIKKTVFLIKGEDRGKKAWYYIAVNSIKIAEFLTALNSTTLNLDAFGTVVSSAYGNDPANAERLEIRQKYPFLY